MLLILSKSSFFFIPQLSKSLKDHIFTADFVKVLVICIPQLLKILKVHIFTVDFVKVHIIFNPQLLKTLKVHIGIFMDLFLAGFFRVFVRLCTTNSSLNWQCANLLYKCRWDPLFSTRSDSVVVSTSDSQARGPRFDPPLWQGNYFKIS